MAQTNEKASAAPAPKKPRGFSNVIGELKKVVWPTRKETVYLTFVVLLVAAAAGTFLGLWDWLLQTLAKIFLMP